MQQTAKPKGLAKIWREVKRPFRQVCGITVSIVSKIRREVKRPFRQIYSGTDTLYHYTRRKLSGLTPEQYIANKNYLSFAQERDKAYSSAFYIRDDGRVHFPQCETDIVLGCNLRCHGCSRYSPWRKGFVPTEKIVQWFETWHQKIHVDNFRLLGGEPFLHPDLESVLLESRRIWNDSTLEIITNGMLIHQASQSVVDALKRAGIKVIISEHSDAPLSREKIIVARARLEENGIPYQVWLVNNIWLAEYQLNKDGIPIPFQCSPHKAHKICVQKRCIVLMNNKLYKCAQLYSIIEGVNEGALSSKHWKNALTYNPLSPDADAAEISKHFRSAAIKECSICPSKRIFIEPRQMPSLSQLNHCNK